MPATASAATTVADASPAAAAAAAAAVDDAGAAVIAVILDVPGMWVKVTSCTLTLLQSQPKFGKQVS